jgi:CHRD domain/PEP-CTERM motif
MKRYAMLLAVASVALLPTPALAAIKFQGVLLGSSEVPANPSRGTGLATVFINDALSTITFQVSFSGLTGNTTAAHVHCCTGVPGANSGIAIETPSLPGFPLGVKAGSFSNSFDLLNADNYNAPFVTNNGGTAASARDALIAGLRGGRSYFNVHSTFRPGGEIRANLVQVPEPASWAMMIFGFALVGGQMRRKAAKPASA